LYLGACIHAQHTDIKGGLIRDWDSRTLACTGVRRTREKEKSEKKISQGRKNEEAAGCRRINIRGGGEEQQQQHEE
jgi:hypothetical protein